MLFFLHNLNLFLGRSEEELALGDTLDLLLTLTRVIPEFNRVLILALEPLDCAVSVVCVEVAVPPSDVRNLRLPESVLVDALAVYIVPLHHGLSDREVFSGPTTDC